MIVELRMRGATVLAVEQTFYNIGILVRRAPSQCRYVSAWDAKVLGLQTINHDLALFEMGQTTLDVI